ncbi:MAG: hypothetical protein ACK5WX_02700 [bacterium]
MIPLSMMSYSTFLLLPLVATLQSAPVAAPAAAPERQAQARPEAPRQVEGMPKTPATPAGVVEVVAAFPFVLDAPYEHDMRKDKRTVTRGHVLVLRCDPAYLLRRQTAEPVLLAGAETVERINIGFDSGVLVALVPESKAKGEDGVERAVDPVASPIYFATPELPERVDAAWIAAEAAKARNAGITAPALAADGRGAEQRFADRDALNRALADLVDRHAPTEGECAAALRGMPPR